MTENSNVKIKLEVVADLNFNLDDKIEAAAQLKPAMPNPDVSELLKNFMGKLDQATKKE